MVDANRPGRAPAGRDDELRRLAARLSPGAPGQGSVIKGSIIKGSVIVVRGQAGIGKTSLLDAALAALTDTVVLRGAGAPDDGAAASRELLAELSRAGVRASDPDDFAAWYEGFADWAGGRSAIVFAVDDVQWCDEPTVRWLSLLARHSTRLPVRMILVRSAADGPEGAAERLADLESWYGTEVLDLGPLPAEAVAALAREAVGSEPGEAFVRHCVEQSGGNPLLLREMLDELGKVASGIAPVAGSAAGAALIHSLFAGVPDYARKVATAIAVLGGQDLSLVARLAKVPARTAGTAVELLRSQHILAAEGFSFRHDPVRDGLLDALEPAELGRWRRTAAILLSDAAGSPEEVAEHLLELAELDSWMVDLLRDAASCACDRGAPWDALRYLRPAAAARPSDGGLAVQLAETVALLEPDSGFDLLRRALELQQDPVDRARAAVKLGRAALVARRCGTAVTVLERVLTVLGGEMDQQLRGHLEGLLCLVGIEDRDSLAKLDTRIQPRNSGGPETVVDARHLAVCAVVAALDGTRPREAAEWAMRAIRGYTPTTDDSAVSSAVLALLLTDEVDVARDELTRAIELVPAQRSEYLAFRGLLGHWCGDLATAAADAGQAYALSRRAEGRTGGVVPRIALATVAAQQGDTSKAMKLLREADSPQLWDHTVMRPWFQLVDARVHWAAGDREAALKLFHLCGESLADVGIANPLLAPWWFEAACLLADEGRFEAAADLAAEGAEPAVRWGTPRAIGMAKLATAVSTRGPGRIGLIEEATAVLAGSPARLEEALAEFHLGRALVDAGDTAAARTHLRRCVELSLRTGDRFLLRRAQRTAAGAGIPSEVTPLASLSPAERHIARLAGRGVSNRVIAERLFVTVRTIETHLTSVYRKLRITGRAELAVVLGHTDDRPAVLEGVR
ncbi:LuxR family transcriptional regulator [Amycolatopsis thailandensis]|uniref:LuxR family transcriptional regulator n=1 Tax=Amycolatopsis thailandensis TaxID=589330 RepID=A0A229RVK0_9PSEU|nr:LuxR C-terminal-related transcriptional regulator [Amycolatopsis thailandensis]OXM50384.1 LuxR family transcriptional regulator [Amycolatopsis thailandensis]